MENGLAQNEALVWYQVGILQFTHWHMSQGWHLERQQEMPVIYIYTYINTHIITPDTCIYISVYTIHVAHNLLHILHNTLPEKMFLNLCYCLLYPCVPWCRVHMACQGNPFLLLFLLNVPHRLYNMDIKSILDGATLPKTYLTHSRFVKHFPVDNCKLLHPQSYLLLPWGSTVVRVSLYQ